MVIYMLFVHCTALLGVKHCFDVQWKTLLFAFILWPISGLGITGGVHRLWAHRSYEAHWSVRFFLMLANSIANQGSIFHWARDHRVHHKHSETDADPHNATRGFFYAHIGWLLVKKHPDVMEVLSSALIATVMWLMALAKSILHPLDEVSFFEPFPQLVCHTVTRLAKSWTTAI